MNKISLLHGQIYIVVNQFILNRDIPVMSVAGSRGIIKMVETPKTMEVINFCTRAI